MQAIRFDDYGTPDVLVLCDLPTPEAGPGQILIRVESAAVNFADLLRRRNDIYPFPTPLPFIPGSEVAGVVEALGAGVDGPAPGTPVFAVVGGDGSTGYAQFAVADAAQVIPIPAGLDADQACGVVVAGLTAMLVLTEVTGLAEGESVFIPAATGGVGTFAVQIARELGAGHVTAGVGETAKVSAAGSSGADQVVVYGETGWADEVRAATGGNGVDVMLEMAGGPMVAASLSLLAPFGRMCIYGLAGGELPRLDDANVRRFLYDPALGQSLSAFNLGLWFGLRPARAVVALQRLIDLVAQGRVTVPVGPTFPLARAADAHRLVEARRHQGKVILNPWPPEA